MVGGGLINYRGTMAGICVEEDRDLPYVLIRLQRIYNFLLFHAIILPVLDVYGLYFTLLYHFWD